jgi:hypothetical protein
MLVYEAVWIVVVPIHITELVFPDRRSESWVRTRGLAIASAVFVVGSFIAWFLWTQQARPNVFHVPAYHPPIVTVLLGALAIVLLGLTGYAVRKAPATSTRSALPPWVMTLATLLLGFPWYALMAVVFVPKPLAPLPIVIAAAAAWAVVGFVVIRHFALSSGFGERHRWALCFGALLVCMLAGFLGASTWPRSDIIAKAVLNVAAVAGMLGLLSRIATAGGGALGGSPQME